jgi:putative membrane protein
VHGRGRPDGRRRTLFIAAVAALGVALVSPLDAMAEALASAHMIQHVLLVLVAAPLLAGARPGAALLRGSPPTLRRVAGRWRRRLTPARRRLRWLGDPVALALVHTATLWFWHAAGPYDAALGSRPLHVLEHLTLLVTAVLFWRVILGGRAAGAVAKGYAVLLLFAMSMQTVFLSLLLTFARAPWYDAYASTTQAWGLDPLADQQLAGVIMWVPAGFIYLGVALGLFLQWLHDAEVETAPLVPVAERP